MHYNNKIPDEVVELITIRKATLDDLQAITGIYNDAILKTVATFDTEPKTLREQEQWFRKHGNRYPILVAEEIGRINGWASLSEWSDRCAYADTAEISLYVQESMRNKGIGKQLMQSILEAGKRAKLHTIIASIADGNAPSVHLHEGFGFKEIGVMKEVGKKFGKRIDVYLMQFIYKSD